AQALSFSLDYLKENIYAREYTAAAGGLMGSLWTAAVSLVFAGMLIMSSAVIFCSTSHTVQCINGQISIDSITSISDLPAQRNGSCMLGEFETRESAEKFVHIEGGTGSSCICR
ncbi:MAG: hypothetical protein ACRCUT_12185, partial [Spirochaetota bacterium]